MALPSSFEPPLVVNPASKHTYTVIAIHGRGSQGPEFREDLFEQKTSSGLNLQEQFSNWKWVFPSSQERYSTVFQEPIDEWFDIYSLTDPSAREGLQVEGLSDSIKHIQQTIKAEAEIVAPNRVILLGLSQGSATGLLALLASQLKIGAFVGLSGWIPFKAHIQEIIKSGPRSQMQGLANFFHSTFGIETLSTVKGEGDYAEPLEPLLQTPVFLGHSVDDEVIDCELGRQARDVLQELGMTVSWKEHKDGGHLAFLESQGLNDIVEFLEKEVRNK